MGGVGVCCSGGGLGRGLGNPSLALGAPLAIGGGGLCMPLIPLELGEIGFVSKFPRTDYDCP